MANANFDPLYSSDRIWRGGDDTRCITDDLDAIESNIDGLETGKAAVNHTHDGYAEADHTHSGYAATEHTHAGFATSDHTHTPASVGAAAADHTHNYAAPTHNHALAEVTGLESTLAGKANVSDMSGKADLVNGVVPSSQLPSFVDDVVEYANLAAFPSTGESGKIYVAQDTNKTYRWSGTSYVVISETVALGETSATAYRGDRGKTAYDHSQNSTVHVTAAQKTAWDSKAEGTHGHSYNDLSDKPTIPTVPASLPANGGNADTVDNKHASDFAAADHSHSVFSGTSASTYRMVYVATDGSDDNTGFSASTPMATIKGVVRKYADKYKMLDIRLADGTYNEDLGVYAVDQCNMSIRSLSSDKDAVTINTATSLDSSLAEMRLYNLTINVTATGIRAVCVNAGVFYAYGVRLTVPEASSASCLNVYNGTTAFIMNSVLNSGTASNSGAAVYGNQAMMVKAIGCTSERKVNIGVHAYNGSDIEYTDTINATTKTKATSYGKCTLRS